MLPNRHCNPEEALRALGFLGFTDLGHLSKVIKNRWILRGPDGTIPPSMNAEFLAALAAVMKIALRRSNSPRSLGPTHYASAAPTQGREAARSYRLLKIWRSTEL